MKIILTILRYTVFCTLILAVGQIPVGRGSSNTLCTEYFSLLSRGWNLGTSALMHTKYYEQVAEWPVFSLILKQPEAPPPSPLAQPSIRHTSGEPVEIHKQARLKLPLTSKIAPMVDDPHEEITASDRESLLRLLK
jgi:hypothetical protein